ncbi:MAG: NAD-dependent epimerase/dehydratase family protein [Thermotogae bacterium]|jgi:UDP-glucose 4-epimerase|nr:NAD-dependent epimerase/dehydratase family protein [Thermotogota bacterium]MCL5033034.1 NAD-dependent epimerase/dehydratase family protein [Thermotogota bacterium]
MNIIENIEQSKRDFFEDKTVLVTGGAGFIGTNLVNELCNYSPKKIIIIDNLFTGLKSNIPIFDFVDFVEGSVENFDLVFDLMKKCDIVFHLAVRNIIVSTKDPEKDFATNAIGTFNILESARRLKNIKKIVYTSSSSVYGNTSHLPITENDSLYALNPYAASKLTGEAYCNAYFETYMVPVSVVRYTNVCGPYSNPSNPYSGVISKFIYSALNNQPITIHGDGEQTRDFTYVDDTIEATISVAISDKSIGEIYNVGTGVETSINNLAKIILEILNTSKSEINHIDKRDIDNIRRRVLDIEKIRKSLRWTPKVTLRDGLVETINWIIKTSGKGI